MKHRITCLFWDVDDTLLDFKASERHALKEALQEQGIYCDESMVQSYSAINEKYWKLLEKGKVTKAELMVRRFQDFIRLHGLPLVDLNRLTERYPKALGEVYFYKDDSGHLLEELKKAGYKNYLVTNGASSIQREKLSRAGILEMVDGIFISEEIGYYKPQEEYFAYCLKKAKEEGSIEEKQQCLLIGDSVSSDMKGAQKAGIPCCYYLPTKDSSSEEEEKRKKERVKREVEIVSEGQTLKVDYQISHLWQIWEILKEKEPGRAQI